MADCQMKRGRSVGIPFCAVFFGNNMLYHGQACAYGTDKGGVARLVFSMDIGSVIYQKIHLLCLISIDSQNKRSLSLFISFIYVGAGF